MLVTNCSSFLPDQVCTVKAPELPNHIPVPSLPEHLGGTSQYSHVAWIQSCVNTHANTAQGDKQDPDAHDCVGSLLRSYSLECGNSSATPSHGKEIATANSNRYDDSNANPHNHCVALEGQTPDNRLQGNHQHWNGSAVSAANASAVLGSCGPNANTNGHARQAPPQSDTPPDTPLSQKSEADAADGRPPSEGGEQEDGEEEEGVPPLPQKSLPRPPHQPYSQSPQLSSSWGPEDDEDERYMEVSVHVPEQGGMTVRDLVEYVKRKKKRGIYQEYEDIRKEPPAGAFGYSKYGIVGLLSSCFLYL